MTQCMSNPSRAPSPLSHPGRVRKVLSGTLIVVRVSSAWGQDGSRFNRDTGGFQSCSARRQADAVLELL